MHVENWVCKQQHDSQTRISASDVWLLSIFIRILWLYEAIGDELGLDHIYKNEIRRFYLDSDRVRMYSFPVMINAVSLEVGMILN